MGRIKSIFSMFISTFCSFTAIDTIYLKKDGNYGELYFQIDILIVTEDFLLNNFLFEKSNDRQNKNLKLSKAFRDVSHLVKLVTKD